MEIQSIEKQRDNTSCGDYEGRFKVESSAQESDVNRTETEQMIQTEQMLKKKEKEAEMWEEKYNKISEELTSLKGKLSEEVCLFLFSMVIMCVEYRW